MQFNGDFKPSTHQDSFSKGLVPKPAWHLTSSLMDRGSGVFSISHCKLTLTRGRALSSLFFHPSSWSGSDRQASVAPGADKSPVSQTQMLGPWISSVACDEDVLYRLFLKMVHTILCKFTTKTLCAHRNKDLHRQDFRQIYKSARNTWFSIIVELGISVMFVHTPLEIITHMSQILANDHCLDNLVLFCFFAPLNLTN